MTAAEREFAVLPLVELDGGAIQVSLLGANGSRISVRLGSAEAVAITGDLIRAARARVGRADWPANAAAVHSALPCPKQRSKGASMAHQNGSVDDCLGSGGPAGQEARACLWCIAALPKGPNRGSKRRFCSSACRAAFHIACRSWAVQAILDGRLTVDAIRNARRQAVQACYRGKSPAGGEEGPGNAPAR